MQFFKGPKNPPLPKSFATIHVLPLKVLLEQVVYPVVLRRKIFNL